MAASAIGSDLEDGELTERDDLGKWGLFAGEYACETEPMRSDTCLPDCSGASCTATHATLCNNMAAQEKCGSQMAAVASTPHKLAAPDDLGVSLVCTCLFNVRWPSLCALVSTLPGSLMHHTVLPGTHSVYSAEPLDADIAEVALLEGATSNQASMLDSAHDIRKGAPPGRQPGSPVQAGAGSGESRL